MLKLKEDLILREVAGSYVVVAVGKAAAEFNAMITLNETGAFLWKALEKGATEDSLTEALLDEYEVDKETASADVKAFIEKIKEAKLLK